MSNNSYKLYGLNMQYNFKPVKKKIVPYFNGYVVIHADGRLEAAVRSTVTLILSSRDCLVNIKMRAKDHFIAHREEYKELVDKDINPATRDYFVNMYHYDYDVIVDEEIRKGIENGTVRIIEDHKGFDNPLTCADGAIVLYGVDNILAGRDISGFN